MMNSRELREVVRTPHAYPVYLVMADCEVVCMTCARKEFKLIAKANRDRIQKDWEPIGVDTNYENPDLYCAHCNNRIESAYADDEWDTVKSVVNYK